MVDIGHGLFLRYYSDSKKKKCGCIIYGTIYDNALSRGKC